MKNKRSNRIISLLLAAMMILSLIFTLASCGGNDADETDAPVTAAAELKNFLGFEDPQNKVLNKVTDLTAELGEMWSNFKDEYAIFLKTDVDRFNNLTDVFTVYSIVEQKVLFTLTNSYADVYESENEFGEDEFVEDEFGHNKYPEKELDCWFTSSDIPVISALYTTYTPIDKEILKDDVDDNYEESYSREYKTDFYDIGGNLITTSKSSFEVDYMNQNDKYVMLSLGKTVGIFDLATYELVESFDGDKDATPVLYDVITDKYNYLLDVPTGYTPDVSVGNSRSAIEVYDKQGKLVCSYSYGDYHYAHQAFVLEGGDILIQKTEYTTSNDCDLYINMDGVELRMNYNNVLLDVETGKVTAIDDFKFEIKDVATKDEFLDMTKGMGYTLTENVRNIISTYDYQNNKHYTVFMDNFGNVNYTFDGKLCYDMDSNGDITVLNDKLLLVEIAVGEADYAVADYNGNIKSYIPKDAYILADYFVSGDSVYSYEMERTAQLGTGWKDNYKDSYTDGSGRYDENSDDNINFLRTAGNLLIYEYNRTFYREEGAEYEYGLIVVDAKNGNYTNYEKYEFYDKLGEYENRTSDVLVIHNPVDNVFKFINANGETLITVETPDYENDFEHVEFDGGVIISIDTVDGYLTALIEKYVMEGDYEK